MAAVESKVGCEAAADAEEIPGSSVAIVKKPSSCARRAADIITGSQRSRGTAIAGGLVLPPDGDRT
jgi:hypothetical protein